MATSQGILASAAASATYNMALQLLFRLGTFILNAFVLRHVSRDLLGVVNVRLMLLYTTTLFVAREAFRRACMSKSTDRRWPQVINLLWLTVPLGVMCAVAFSLIWIYVLEAPDARLIPHYQKAVVIFALCTLIELLAEPLWVIGQVLLFVRLRVIIEGIALASRCLFTVGFVLAFPKWGLWTFCIAQVMHSVIYTSLYYAYFAYYMWSGKATDDFPFKSMRDFLPRAQPGKELINPGLASLTWSFFKQSSLKQLLTEGERYVMTVFSILSFADQGLYDVINNLGSLAARFIFLPIEDAAYLLFSHTLDRGIPVKEQSKDNLELSSVVLDCLLKFVILVGLTILVFGIAYAELALDLYGGTILSSGTGPMLLRWYCFYVLVIALNGVTESFVFASMSKQQVDKYNQKLLVFSFVFLTSSLVLTRYLGSVGFILANCLNMGSRIVHSLYYIHQYYKDTTEKPLLGMIPYKPVIAALSSSFLLTFCSMRLFCCSRGVVYRMAHVAIGGICFFLVIIIIYFTEQPLINFIRDQWRKRYSQQTEQREIETTTQQKIKGSKDD